MSPRVGLLATLVAAVVVVQPAVADFPFYFDVGGINSSVFNKLVPVVPQVKFGAIFECPHPAGRMPSYQNGIAINGGVPQRANLSLHLSILNDTLNKYVALSDNRFIDLDYESWNPVWERNAADGPYQNESRHIVRTAHPSWSNAQIEAQAKKEWEAAAKMLLVETIQFVRSVRPKLKIGAYSFPNRFYYHGYNSSSGDMLRDQNDGLYPLWCHFDALFPSVYQFYDSCNSTDPARTRASNSEYIFSTVAEAVRIAKDVPQKCESERDKLPVFAYTWHRYHSGTDFITCGPDESQYWNLSKAAGADAIVLWGDERASQPAFMEYWRTFFGPLARESLG